MRRHRVIMEVSVIVRANTEEEAIGLALENVHDSTIRHIVDVEEMDDRPCLTKSTLALKSSVRS